jgi:hypothetical protein
MKKYLLLASIFFLVGCPHAQPKPENSFISTNKDALVFGRLQIFQNGHDYTSDNHIMFIYPLISTTGEPCWDQWAIPHKKKLDFQDGYFFLSLPPGKYCLTHIAYYPDSFFGIKLASNSFLTIFADIPGATTDVHSNNSLLFFEVLPNRANYIGTIRVEITCCSIKQADIIESNDQGKTTYAIPLNQGLKSYRFIPIDDADKENQPFVLWLRSGPFIYVDSWNVLDEQEKAFLEFEKLYPNHSVPAISMLTAMKKPWRQESRRELEFFDIRSILEKYKVTDVTYHPPISSPTNYRFVDPPRKKR